MGEVAAPDTRPATLAVCVATYRRPRGLLALLTARSRATPVFQEYEVEDIYTFLDLLKLLGFTQLTVTDGDQFAHRIYIK